MGWTKQQFIDAAFDEIGLASYMFDLQPEQLQIALQKLDSMMAAWNAKGIRIGYPIPTNALDSSLNDESNVPDSANEAIFLNLAVRLAPSYGKQLQLETKQNAKASYDTLLARAAMPNEMQLGVMPSGAGNRRYQEERPFLPPPVDRLQAGEDTTIDFY